MFILRVAPQAECQDGFPLEQLQVLTASPTTGAITE